MAATKAATTPWVLIVMGSDSDAAVMSEAAAVLDEFRVPYEMTVASAHRSPERTKSVITEAERGNLRGARTSSQRWWDVPTFGWGELSNG